MNTRRFVLTSVVLFVTAVLWNALVQLVVLREANRAAQALWRNDLGNRLWLSLLLTAAVVIVFVAGYSRFAVPELCGTSEWRPWRLIAGVPLTAAAETPFMLPIVGAPLVGVLPNTLVPPLA